MARQDVLNALDFYDSSSSTWVTHPGHPPADVSSADQAILTTAIMRLYDDSPTARAYLETLAATGAIRISSGSTGPNAVRPIDLGGGVWTVPYLNFPDTSPDIYAMTGTGDIFQMSLETLVGHELSHLMGTNDPAGTSNTVMNNPNFDYVGDTVRDEWTISLDLGETQQRATYAAGFVAGSSRYNLLDLNGDYVPDGGHVDIIRFGDLIGQSIDDEIDLSTRTDGRSALIFGMSGDDTINVTDQQDYVYGGDGEDIIYGHADDDYLWGEDDDDVIYGGDGDDKIYAGNDNDTVEGGSGADIIEGGDGSDILIGGQGEDELHGGAGNDLIKSGDETSLSGVFNIISGGGGDDIIIAENGTWTVAEGGDGADHFYIDLNVSGIYLDTSLEIEDSDSDDRIYWNSHELLGGPTMIIDFEYDGQYGEMHTGALDSNGVIYRLDISGTELEINLPDGGEILIYDFENGDFGIMFDNMMGYADITVDRDANNNIIGWTPNVPISNIVDDDSFFNFADLDGRSYAIANPGSFYEPLVPLI